MNQEFLNVLFVGLAINGIIVVVLILAPAIRSISQRRAAGRHAAAVAASGIRRPADHPVEAGRPWFPDASARGYEGRAADGSGLNQALPEIASTESWRTWLAEESARTTRYHRPATIVVVELLGLDRLAERVGSAAANRLLPPVLDTIQRHARAADRLARIGPTRFGVLLIETDEVQAINYVERIRSGCDLWLAAGAVALRLSIGWAEIQVDRPGDAAFIEAERRLYADCRRFEPAKPVEANDGRDGLTPALQTFGA